MNIDDDQTKFEPYITPDLDDTEVELGDMDQTLLESHSVSPVSIQQVPGAEVTTVNVICNIGLAAPPLGELIAHTFWEINKLNLVKAPAVCVKTVGTEMPFGVACIIMAHLQKNFDIVKVFCNRSKTFETVSL